MSNITQVINTDKNMKQLKKGVHHSDLDQLLSSSGPFTFFAPSDLAFDKLEKGYIDGLMSDKSKGPLTELLNNHLVNGRFPFKDMKDGDKIKTVNGRELLINMKDGNISINGATIIAREQKISNGVMFSTDAVFVN
jgi:uncharacterized surface protein with fasciclin (FAS1) repeats